MLNVYAGLKGEKERGLNLPIAPALRKVVVLFQILRFVPRAAD